MRPVLHLKDLERRILTSRAKKGLELNVKYLQNCYILFMTSRAAYFPRYFCLYETEEQRRNGLISNGNLSSSLSPREAKMEVNKSSQNLSEAKSEVNVRFKKKLQT